MGIFEIFNDEVPFSTDIPPKQEPTDDSLDGNMFLLSPLPEPEKGFYFLTCAWCGRKDFWSFKSTSPAMWVNWDCDEKDCPIYPLRPYVCDNCHHPVNTISNPVEYHEYLRSNHWQVVRKSALSRSLNRCQLCTSSRRLEVHHNNYKNLGRELPADVVVLCASCHRRHHGK